ncbi:unnamed protein product [Adineta steineri]|uniref:Uncharacterized protein n=1 Tax=Adineta steineri TaxID=433720 RepID=A0A814ZHV3_9BILA|nr:unnamed protein product [Adineta steineri]CAF1243783.1 unnamed protein product [Adineta steineri]CAF1413862.1 unnamed protein product [Adineta steineri]
MMLTNRTIYLLNISIKRFSNYSLIRFASWNTNNKLHEVGLFTTVKQEGNYQTGQVCHIVDGWIDVKYTLEHAYAYIKGHLSSVTILSVQQIIQQIFDVYNRNKEK